MSAHPASFIIQQSEGSNQWVVLRNGESIHTARSEHDAQVYIDTWRQVAARLELSTGDALPLDVMTPDERAILAPSGTDTSIFAAAHTAAPAAPTTVTPNTATIASDTAADDRLVMRPPAAPIAHHDSQSPAAPVAQDDSHPTRARIYDRS